MKASTVIWSDPHVPFQDPAVITRISKRALFERWLKTGKWTFYVLPAPLTKDITIEHFDP